MVFNIYALERLVGTKTLQKTGLFDENKRATGITQSPNTPKA